MIQSRPMTSNRKRKGIVHKLYKIQLIMGLVTIAVFWIFKPDIDSVLSGVSGLLLAIIPTVVHAKIAFGDGRIVSPGIVYSRHKYALIARFVLNVVLFASVFYFYKRCDYIVLFVTYFITLSGYWISLLRP